MKKKTRFSQLPYHLMLLPGVVFVLLFNTSTWLGIALAFQDFIPSRGWFGSPWVGFENFELFFSLPDSFAILRNTVVIAAGKITAGTLVSILFALLLNELKGRRLKKCIQTAVYLPHFISWVIFATIMRSMLGTDGLINQILRLSGAQESVMFLGTPSLFPIVMIATETLKEFGFGAIVYLSAITAIDPALYEAAAIDGAGRWKQTIHVTLPGLRTIIVLMATLSLGSVLDAGFDQIFNMYNALVYSTGDIIDTYVYRVGLVSFNYGLGSAVGLFKSVIGITLMAIAYWLASKFADYRIF